jgi:hypothetical protein
VRDQSRTAILSALQGAGGESAAMSCQAGQVCMEDRYRGERMTEVEVLLARKGGAWLGAQAGTQTAPGAFFLLG